MENTEISLLLKDQEQILEMLDKGAITSITGETGCGKTTFAIQLITSIALSGEKVWIGSYEMTTELIQRKIASQLLGKDLKNEKLSKEEINDYRKNYTSKYDIFLDSNRKPLSIDELLATMEEAKRQHGIEYFLIDPVEHISRNGKNKLERDSLDDIVQNTHEFATIHNVHIINVFQSATNSIKGSSSIKQYSDNVLILHRLDRTNDEDEGKVDLRVCKNRALGKEGTVPLFYDEKSDRFHARVLEY